MLPCEGCAYRESIPGDAHIRCVFLWQPKDVFVAPNRRVAQWFLFPFNYDPMWGPDTCPHRAEGERDPAKTAPPNPISDLLSILGGKHL